MLETMLRASLLSLAFQVPTTLAGFTQTTPRIDSVQLVAPRLWRHNETYQEARTYRVAVFSGRRADTLQSVFVSDTTMLVGDSVVYGFLSDSTGDLLAGFQY